ncbi:MAG: hypothetical protein PHR35_10600 [Kiritimatiellae bacterium]|nr:hypothetical protein [Kiritimatiellia bacterium]
MTTRSSSFRARRLQAWFAGGIAVLLVRLVSGAFCEFTVTLASNSPSGAAAADVVVWPFGVDETRAGVTVRDAAGATVGHETIWRAPGAAWTIRFDAASGKQWIVRIEDAPAQSNTPPWQARCGVLLETRALANGTAETLEDMRRLWSGNTVAFGRSEVGRIHHGIHPHGPNQPLMARFEGSLSIPAAGRYGFATFSDDASFLLINGRSVAAWGGWHEVGGGLGAQYAGEIDLPAGLCRIEYYNVQDGAAWLVGAAWRPPGVKHYKIIPDSAFVPVGRAVVTAVTASDAGAALASFGWEAEAHVQADTYYWVHTRLRTLTPAGDATYRWRFDDGGAAEGIAPAHLFLSPGVRSVMLEVERGGRVAGRLTRQIAVQPRWTQPQEFDEGFYDKLRTELLSKDLARIPVADLCQAVLLAERVADTSLVKTLGGVCLKRLTEFDAAAAPALYRLGFHFQSPAVRDYAQVPVVWRALLARPGVGAAVAARTRLHFAGFLIHSGGGLGEALALLKACDAAQLDAGEQRLYSIYKGDAAATAGDAVAAQRWYTEAGATGAPDDTAYEVGRLARLERARLYLKWGEYEAAETSLRTIEWERPMCRLGLETGLLLIELFRARGEEPFALAACRRLLAVAPPGPRQAALLRATAEVCAAQGLTDEARLAFKRLHDNFPYSEEAALTKDRMNGLSGTGR